MTLGRRGRSFTGTVFGPVANGLVRLGVSPDAVTVTGTLLTVAASFGLLAQGHLVAGPLVLAVILLSDSIDGLMARRIGRSSRWGAFLDSTMDRFGDAAVYSALALYGLSVEGPAGTAIFACGFALVPLALIVSYARARAEAVGLTAAVGFAERTDRLIVTLVAAFLVGLGLDPWVLAAGLGIAALGSLITIFQRMATVAAQDRAAAASEGSAPGGD